MSQIITTFLDNELEKIVNYFPYLKRKSITISQADVAWHLSHCLLVMDKIYEGLKHSNPADYKSQFNLKRTITFGVQYFPRGVAKSPKMVLPEENITQALIEKQLIKVRAKLSRIDELDPNVNFTHFIFGQCDRKRTKQFLKIHTNHHLKIVRDILNESI